MPDSQQPPFWGPAYDERDLDALLSGEAASTPGGAQAGREHPGRAPRARDRPRALRRGGGQGRVPRVRDGAADAVGAVDGGGRARGRYRSHSHSSAAEHGCGPRRRPRAAGTAARPGACRRPGIALTGRRGGRDRDRGGGHRRHSRLDRAAHVLRRQPARACASARSAAQPPGPRQVLGRDWRRPRDSECHGRPRSASAQPARDHGSGLALPRVLRVPSSTPGTRAGGGRPGSSSGNWASWRAVRPRSSATACASSARSWFKARAASGGAYPGGHGGERAGGPGDRESARPRCAATTGTGTAGRRQGSAASGVARASAGQRPHAGDTRPLPPAPGRVRPPRPARRG